MTAIERLWETLEQPIDIALLVCWRVGFGALLLISVLRFFVYGWIDQLYVQPGFFFTYEGFSWVQPWPAWGMKLHFVLMGSCALGIMLGAWYRLSVAGFWLLFTYVELIDKTNYLNHYYFVSLLCFLLIWMPLHRSLSVDAWRRPLLRGSTIARGCLWLLRFQVAVVYFFAGVAKLKVDWLWYGQPLRIWLASHADLPLLGPWLAQPWVALLMSWGGAFFDLTIVGWLLWRRARWPAYLVVIGFHLLTWKLFLIGVFPWVMIVSAALFFSPKGPRPLLDRWALWRQPEQDELYAKKSVIKQGEVKQERAGRTGAEQAEPTEVGAACSSVEGAIGSRDRQVGKVSGAKGSTKRRSWRRFGLSVLVGSYVLLQLLLPLRHWLIPGPVMWTEEGYRFSWKVMLMEKTGHVDFWVEHPATGRRWLVAPREHLTRLQVKMMSTQPDMILAFAHWLAKDFQRRGIGPVRVRADAFVSLNGRPRQRFLDPKVDLAQQPLWTWRHRSWILPFRGGPPPAPKRWFAW